ncbi:hypothetical protein [Ktedonosporobacter rubrisoli]|nr:hypothetical protein [Ktedonosporobacter rubrisoli]
MRTRVLIKYALLGARLLSEGHKWQRLGAAGIIMLGIILLALN